MSSSYLGSRTRRLLVFAALTALAAMQLVAIFTHPAGPWFTGMPDDFKRDVVGVSAAGEGESPYRLLGDFMELSDAAVQGQWVAHTPASLVVATAALKVAGDVDAAALSARLVAAGLVLATLLVGSWSRRWWIVAIPLLAVATASFGCNWLWNQHGVVIATLFACALRLDSAGSRSAGMLILGLIVSLKPWLLPAAALLPSSRSAVRDVSFVSATAAGVTLACLPAIGGWHGLRDWLAISLPSNYEQWSATVGNLSLTAGLPGLLSFALIFLIPLGIAVPIRKRIPRHLWPIIAWLCILTLPRLVWNHYLVDASPLILSSLLLAPLTYRRGPILVGLATVLPSTLALWLPLERIGSMGLEQARGVAIVLLSAALLAYARQRLIPDRSIPVLDKALALVGAGSNVPPRAALG